jgi:hypothetical protein
LAIRGISATVIAVNTVFALAGSFRAVIRASKPLRTEAHTS